MAETQSEVAPRVRVRKNKKPRAYVRLTIRPMLASDAIQDISCIVIGAPDTERYALNIAAFKARWPTSNFLYFQD